MPVFPTPPQQQPLFGQLIQPDFAQYDFRVKSFSASEPFIEGMTTLFQSGYTDFEKNKVAMIQQQNSAASCIELFSKQKYWVI